MIFRINISELQIIQKASWKIDVFGTPQVQGEVLLNYAI